MKTLKRTLIGTLLAMLAACSLVVLSGCFSVDPDTATNDQQTTTDNPISASSDESGLIGTWTLEAAYDYSGDEYDISSFTSQVSLVVTSMDSATFNYFDDDPFTGTLERATDQDSYYAAEGYTVQAYNLIGSDGSYWEFAYVVPDDSTASAFVYLEVGESTDYDSIYLTK